MKAILFASALLAGVACIGTHANAQNYPWCAFYGGKGGGTNCGFVSFGQCMATVRGMGGYCARNVQYVPFAAVPDPRRHARRRKRYK